MVDQIFIVLVHNIHILAWGPNARGAPGQLPSVIQVNNSEYGLCRHPSVCKSTY